MRIKPLSVTAIFIGSLCSANTIAQARPDTLRMSCGAAADLVRRSGAIVLGTGPDIYDRYVASHAYCERDEFTFPRWLAARDVRQCFVGYGCERRYGGDGTAR